ncbi:MAG TPA: VOC family protein [Clostridia bacterium]|nr:VOC family protein [Clostridia bacterium]
MIMENGVMFILYVRDQEKSKHFYESLLNISPSLDVPGMTEFTLSKGIILGIMPGDGIEKILDNKVGNPNRIDGLPRCEVYLFVDNPDNYYEKAIEIGGQGISKGAKRNWGDYVSYCSDFDGNIIAFAT